MMVSVGKMRERCEVVRMTNSYADGMGGMHRVLDVVGKFWCYVNEMPASRSEATFNTEVISPIEFTIRSSSTMITEEDLIRYRGTEYKIHSVRHDYQRRYQIITAYGNENN